jgi:type VI secretion system protein VasD
MGVFRLGFAALAVVAGAVTCSHTPPPPPPAACTTPESIQLLVQASDRLNPNEKGESLATVLRVYQLKASSKITMATFESMLDRDRETLGDDLVSSQELTLNPAEKIRPAVERGQGVGHVAVVALFRKPAGISWRAVKDLPAPDPQHCHKGEKAKGDAGRPASPMVQVFLRENRLEIR